MLYVYPKYITPVVKRRAALERSALEKEKHFGHLGDGAKVNIISNMVKVRSPQFVYHIIVLFPFSIY